MRRSVSVLLIMALVLMSMPSAFAQSSEEVYIVNYGGITPSANSLHSPDAEIRLAGAGVAVFVAGILIGFVVDGVIIYTTGHSAGELTASAIDKIVKFVKNNPQYTYVTYNPGTGVVGGGMGGGGGGAW